MSESTIPIGYKVKTGETYSIVIPENKTSTMNKNYFCISSQGSGKTNLIQLFIYEMFKLHKDTDGEFGCIPIVFAPTFEYMQLGYPSRNFNLPPGYEPEGLECVHITFPCCEPPDDKRLIGVTFDFNSLSVEDIGAFAGLASNNKLGFIQKIIEQFKYGYMEKTEDPDNKKKKIEVWHEPKPNYTVDDFLKMVQQGNHETKDALYYVFSKLKEMRLFDEENRFEMRKYVKEKKAIVIHFGDLDDKDIISALAGLVLRELWDIGKEFYNAKLKQQRHDKLNDWEKFLLKYWTVGLLMEEAHQILYATKSSGLAMESKHPAHVWFKKITSLMGRKRMFKYSIIVTQKFMEIYYGVRTSFHYLILGNNIYPDDKKFLEEDLKVDEAHINEMTNLPKFCWTMLDIDRYQKRVRRCAVKFKAHLSPAGQAKEK